MLESIHYSAPLRYCSGSTISLLLMRAILSSQSFWLRYSQILATPVTLIAVGLNVAPICCSGSDMSRYQQGKLDRILYEDRNDSALHTFVPFVLTPESQ